MGNSGYGKTITDQLKHRNVEYCSDSEVSRNVNTPLSRIIISPMRRTKSSLVKNRLSLINRFKSAILFISMPNFARYSFRFSGVWDGYWVSLYPNFWGECRKFSQARDKGRNWNRHGQMVSVKGLRVRSLRFVLLALFRLWTVQKMPQSLCFFLWTVRTLCMHWGTHQDLNRRLSEDPPVALSYEFHRFFGQGQASLVGCQSCKSSPESSGRVWICRAVLNLLVV